MTIPAVVCALPGTAIIAYGAQGLGAVKRALPTADYAQIKLVAAMMNTRQHWFAPAVGAGDGAGAQAGAAPARENVPANGGDGSGGPVAKRQRTSSGGSG